MPYITIYEERRIWDLPPLPPRNEAWLRQLGAMLEAGEIAGVERCDECEGLGSILNEYEFIEPEYRDCPDCVAAGCVPIEHEPDPPRMCMGEDRPRIVLPRRYR
jgi:hypothetical protein